MEVASSTSSFMSYSVLVAYYTFFTLNIIVGIQLQKTNLLLQVKSLVTVTYVRVRYAKRMAFASRLLSCAKV